MITTSRHYFAYLLAAFIAISLVAAQHAAGEVTYTETEGANKLTVIRMTVTPEAKPVPALKHRLLATELELKSGNAAPFYYRAFIAARAGREGARQEFTEEELTNWYATGQSATPLSQLPIERLRRAVELTCGDWLMRELTAATSRRECDWGLGIRDLRGHQIIAFELDEFQRGRDITRVLSMRTRLALAEQRYDDAIDTMRMNYRLAQDASNVSLLVCGLIGISQCSVMNGPLVELIASRDSPNMYWALSELPSPLIDMRPAVRFELSMPKRMFPLIENASTTERTHEEWNALLKQVARDFPKVSGRNVSLPHYEIAMTGMALVAYPHAKARLIAQGMDRDRVEQMPVGQVIAIYSEQICDRISHEYEKLWYLPFWEMRAASAKVKAKLESVHPLGGGADREVLPIMTLLLPALESVRESQVRLEREVASLRVIEALRIYAATHDRKLPAKLSDVTEVPIPPNPATGQAFAYRLEGGTAILELPASDGIRNQNRRYEITIQQN